MKKNKKVIVIILFFISCFFICLLDSYGKIVVADHSIQSINATEDELRDIIDEQLGSLDTDKLEENMNIYGNEYIDIFNSDIKTTLKKIINGEIVLDYRNIATLILSIFTNQIKSVVPIFASIIGIGILLSLVKEFNLTKRNDIRSIINLSFIGLVAVICIVQISQFFTVTKQTLNAINNQMEAIFPLLLTTLTVVGGTKSALFYQPVIAFLCNAIIAFIINILLPVVIVILVISICSNLSENIKLNKFKNFLTNFFKWSIGVIFTIFFAFVTIQGISVASVDSISIRTAKFSIRTFIPLVGGFLSDSFNIIIAGSVLIKNAIGFTGVILLFSSLLTPVISMICYKFCLELTSSFLEPISENNLCEFLVKLSGILTLLISVIIICAVMYLILVAMIMSTANMIG